MYIHIHIYIYNIYILVYSKKYIKLKNVRIVQFYMGAFKGKSDVSV